MALELVSLRVLLFPNIIPPMPHTHVYVNYTLIRTSERKYSLSFITEHWREKYFMVYFLLFSFYLFVSVVGLYWRAEIMYVSSVSGLLLQRRENRNFRVTVTAGASSRCLKICRNRRAAVHI